MYIKKKLSPNYNNNNNDGNNNDVYLDGTIFSTAVKPFLALPAAQSLVAVFELDVSDVTGVPGFMLSVFMPVLSTIICLTLNCNGKMSENDYCCRRNK